MRILVSLHNTLSSLQDPLFVQEGYGVVVLLNIEVLRVVSDIEVMVIFDLLELDLLIGVILDLDSVNHSLNTDRVFIVVLVDLFKFVLINMYWLAQSFITVLNKIIKKFKVLFVALFSTKL